MNFSILPGNTGLLLGIGGSGMSSLAHILLDMGFTIYGYDKKQTEITGHLTERGATIYPNLDSIDARKINFIIFSSAINDKNHEIFSEVSKLSIPMFHRSDVLHKIFSLSNSVSVAGSHGKTSTTTMLAQVLESEKLDPSIMIGGDTDVLGKKGGKFGKGKWGVYESDESDGTFLKHKANIRIVTNVDNDHLDHYHTREKLENAFLEYISPGTEGIAILQGQDEGIQSILNALRNKANISSKFKLYVLNEKSFEKNANYSITMSHLKTKLGNQLVQILFEIKNGECFFTYLEKEYSLRLPFSGVHYLTNALCALFASLEIGISLEKGLITLVKYVGVKRRQEVLGIKNDIKVIDDYGHHPTEIRTVIQSLKEEMKRSERLVVLFQPHRYTRTSFLQKELANSLDPSDFLFLLPIYSAGENLIPGISAGTIAKHLKTKSYQILNGPIASDVESIRTKLGKGDTFLCIGAGNVRDWGIEFLK
jgi:UDP-N-acetylmuramate--alanine ligase